MTPSTVEVVDPYREGCKTAQDKLKAERAGLHLKHAISRYFSSWWLPGAAYLVWLAVFILPAFLLPIGITVLEISSWAFLGVAAAFVGIAVAFVLNLVKRKWPVAAVNFGLLLVSGATTNLAFGLLLYGAMIFPTKDHFADNLTIPAGIVVNDPLPVRYTSTGDLGSPKAVAEPDGPSFELRDSVAGAGTYDSEIWVNPGEPGIIYLKAYEVTKGTRLSAEDLKRRTQERVGWSVNPRQHFFAGTEFTI